MAFETKDGITLAIAAVGAVLGIINTWHSMNQRRVKLRVIPKYAEAVKFGFLVSSESNGKVGCLDNDMGCIEVINLSAFPITLNEIGFTKSRKLGKYNRIAIPLPLTSDRKPFARRLESREAITGYFRLQGIGPDAKNAYAKTDCGVVFYGTSPAFREMIRRMY